MNQTERFREIASIIKGIGDVGSLTSENLIHLVRSLYEPIVFCGCKNEVYDGYGIQHSCKEYSNIYKPHHNSEHVPLCFCCQTRVFLYYLGRCMEKLADDDKLPQFNEAGLSHARIRERTYGHIKIGSQLIFSIERHPRMQKIIETWVFDFADLSLKELSYDAATVGISVRGLLESKSEWKGTASRLLSELKKVAERLKINTKSDLWPGSPYKLNLILQDLREYLQEFGITIERQRNLRLVKN